MKKFFLFFTAFAVLFVFYACSSKELSPMQERMQKHLRLNGVKEDIVKNFNYRVNVNSLIEIELSLQSDKDMDISYKITWLDEDGFELKSASFQDEKKVSLKEGRSFLLQRVASNKDVTNFIITLTKE